MVGNHQAANGALAFNRNVDAQADQDATTRRLEPDRTALERKRAAYADEPVMNNASCKGKRQRHSAPAAAQHHGASGARKRLRAAGESISRSSKVRKSMVRNSRSKAGGAAMRAPMAR